MGGGSGSFNVLFELSNVMVPHKRKRRRLVLQRQSSRSTRCRLSWGIGVRIGGSGDGGASQWWCASVVVVALGGGGAWPPLVMSFESGGTPAWRCCEAFAEPYLACFHALE